MEQEEGLRKTTGVSLYGGLSLTTFGFFFVAEPGEISNLDVIRDIDRIIKLEEALSRVM